VTVSPVNSYSGTVSISCSAPAGITCTPATASPTVGSGVSDNIAITAASTVAAGTYPAMVTATGGGHTHTAQILIAYTPVTATPTFSLAAGTYTAAQTVTISDASPGAVIFYTTNGSAPTLSSSIYSGPISVAATETLKAVAIATGYSVSPAASASYTIAPPAATPGFSPVAGTYSAAQTVTISDANAGATIYYTINGNAPTAASTKYAAAIKVASTETLKAIAVATGYSTSAVASAAYTISSSSHAAVPPTFSPAAGTYHARQSVTISDAATGIAIYYTLDGTTPTAKSTLYRGAVSVSKSQTLQAIAVAVGGVTSNAASAAYNLVAANPVITPASGTYPGPLTVTITTATPTATIFYTTNGTVPSVNSSVYTGPITISKSEKVYAIAAETGFTSSVPVGAIYVIDSAATVKGRLPESLQIPVNPLP
jgi:hypothetical protein